MPTFLSQNVFVQSTYDTSRILPYGNITVVANTRPNVNMGQTSRVTFEDPNWRVKVAKGVNATNPYRKTSFSNVVPGTVTARAWQIFGGNTTELITEQRRLQAYGRLGPVTDASLLSVASGRIKRKLRVRTDEMRTIVPLVEFREVSRCVTSLANYTFTFLEALVDLRKRKYKRGSRKLEKLAADMWLNFNFGIRPMVGDVSAAVSAMETFLKREDYPVRLSSGADKEWRESGKSDVYNLGNMMIRSSYEIIHTLSYRITAGFDLSVFASNDYSVKDQFGLNLKNVPVSLYELTGFSWVADYFVNVGAYLEDLFYSPPGDTKYLSCSRKYVAQCREKFWAESINSNTKIISCVATEGTWNFTDFERTSLSQLPHVALRFKAYDEVGNFAVSKLLNLLAILRK
jgi:hypothetical protein